jgi:hypothetical protein
MWHRKVQNPRRQCICMTIDHSINEACTRTVRYPEELDFLCPICGHPVHFCFSRPKHDYQDADREVREYLYLYQCTNPDCDMSQLYFNPAPLNVLPYKKYSLALWKFIAVEAKLHGQKPEQIVDRIQQHFHKVISVNTVRNYINEINVYVSGKIDEKTVDIVKAQGMVLISMDGQKPEKDGSSLWLFVDVISNRVLRVAILETADHETLHGIVDSILNDFGVRFAGMISDKQNSIVKMHDLYYPDIPHQYCHFHFLQNLWGHLELKDGHVHKELAKGINHLYITSTTKDAEVHLENGERQKVRELFGVIEKDLRKLVKNSSKKFDHLRGIETFDKLAAYVDDIMVNCVNEDPSRWVVRKLMSTATVIRDALEEQRSSYEDCRELNMKFQDIRSLLGNPNMARAEKILNLDGVFELIWKDAQKPEGITTKNDLRSFLPTISSTKDEILFEWVRLYESYKPGLFVYYDLPVPARSNVEMEKKFGQEKSRLVSQCAKMQVGMQIRTRGGFHLRELYVGKAEVEKIIEGIDASYDDEQVKAGLEELDRHIKDETENWKMNVYGTDAIKNALKFGRKDEDKKDLDEVRK